MSRNIISRIKKWYRRPNKNFLVSLVEDIVIILPVVFIIKTFVLGLYQVPTGCMETEMLVGERFFADKFSPIFSKPKRGEIISFNEPNFQYSDNKLINLYQQYVDWNVLNYTKRVIAIPGDHLQGKIDGGKAVIYLNNKKLDEPYLNKYPLISIFEVSSDDPTGAIVRRTYDPKLSLRDQQFYRLDRKDIEIARSIAFPPYLFYRGTPVYDGSRCVDEFDVKLKDNQYWVMGDSRQGSFDSRFWGPLDISKSYFHGRIIFRIWSIDSNYSWWILDLIKHPIDFWSRMRWARFFKVLH